MENYEDAIGNFKKSLELDPSQTLYDDLANVILFAGRKEESKQYYKKAEEVRKLNNSTPNG